MIAVAALGPDDREAWQTLFAGYNAFYGRSWPAERYEQAWQTFMRAETMHALGGRLDGRLVGIAHFLVHPSTTSADLCYLQDLFTDPDVRGRGVGRSLIEAVSAWAADQGCARLYWHTQRHNDAARRLYDQLGEHRDFIVYTRQL
ncbi:GNAT family N-acetyltransferase [Dactylosporangium vinaceum]|uniref:GNAT family N-acetyltransferase n=1 Tax=Dactylosporangium vinaceum TaxID=53362 RepID=A0ABV5MSM3_9ACTN|nr:GNAT family N-acetyltransferase [Dactylosporangium vinaceum]UAC00117.1 GNAT family N-acetyltransferase [Dactylosporangium vinaceum]